MGVYYNKNKKIFIESDLSDEVLKKQGFRPVRVVELYPGYCSNIWILEVIESEENETVTEIISDSGSLKYYYDCYDSKCVTKSKRKIENLDEIRIYFKYLKSYISKASPSQTTLYADYIKSKLPFKEYATNRYMPEYTEYLEYYKNNKLDEKNSSISLQIPAFDCKYITRDYGTETIDCYLYYPFLSVIAGIRALRGSGYDSKSERYERYENEIRVYGGKLDCTYKLFDILGMKEDEIDFEDISSSLVLNKTLKKSFEQILGSNAEKIEELKAKVADDLSKKFEKEFKKNDKVRKDYIDTLKSLLEKIDTLTEDSRFNGMKEEFFKEISLAAQNNFLEFQKLLTKTIEDIDEKRQETIRLGKELSILSEKVIRDTDSKLEKLTKEAETSLINLQSKKNELIKSITEDVIGEVIKRNPVQEININLNDPNVRRKVKGIYHNAFKKVLQLIYLKSPVFLVGPAGCGKNVMLKQAAKVLDLDFYYTNDAKEKYDLLGFVDANGKYQETQFFKAFTKGGLLMIDEIDNAEPAVLLLLNSALGTGDDFYMSFPDGNHYQAHPDFHLVAAANTFGTGANQTYCGRNQLDGASLNRFVPVPVDYDTNIERTLVNNPEILPLYWEVRRIIRENEINYVVSTRNILNADKYISAKSFDLDDIFAWTLVGSMTEYDLAIIISNLTTTDKYTIDFINYVKTKYNIEEAKQKTKTRSNDDYGYGY